MWMSVKFRSRADEWVWGFEMGFRKSWMSLECLKSVQENLEQEKEADILQNLDGEQIHRKKFWLI